MTDILLRSELNGNTYRSYNIFFSPFAVIYVVV